MNFVPLGNGRPRRHCEYVTGRSQCAVVNSERSAVVGQRAKLLIVTGRSHRAAVSIQDLLSGNKTN